MRSIGGAMLVRPIALHTNADVAAASLSGRTTYTNKAGSSSTDYAEYIAVDKVIYMLCWFATLLHCALCSSRSNVSSQHCMLESQYCLIAIKQQITQC